jgi:chemotaxis protein methyltransferase CheR
MEGDRAHVRTHLHDAIEWRRVNLIDGSAVSAMGTFDLILCRNVFIYFADATVARVVGSLASTLRDGGHLLVGASESLMRFGTLLESQERGGAFFYVRPLS